MELGYPKSQIISMSLSWSWTSQPRWRAPWGYSSPEGKDQTHHLRCSAQWCDSEASPGWPERRYHADTGPKLEGQTGWSHVGTLWSNTDLGSVPRVWLVPKNNLFQKNMENLRTKVHRGDPTQIQAPELMQVWALGQMGQVWLCKLPVSYCWVGQGGPQASGEKASN